MPHLAKLPSDAFQLAWECLYLLWMSACVLAYGLCRSHFFILILGFLSWSPVSELTESSLRLLFCYHLTCLRDLRRENKHRALLWLSIALQNSQSTVVGGCDHNRMSYATGTTTKTTYTRSSLLNRLTNISSFGPLIAASISYESAVEDIEALAIYG